MRTKTKAKSYALMWHGTDGTEDDLIYSLVYRPPTGPEVRTYYEGHLDPRAGDESSFPRFDTLDETVEFMREHPGEKCLVEVGVARRIYPKGEAFASPV